MMRIPLAVTVITVLVAIGCQNEHHDDSSTPSVRRDELANDAKLSGMPQPVIDSFTRQHPGAAISTVAPLPSQGPPLYKIVYIQNGAPGSVTYRYDGAVYDPPPQAPSPRVSP